MTRKDVRVCLFLVFISFSRYGGAVTIGSDTVVTRFNTQQILNDGDVVAAFAGLNAGFKLADGNTQALVRTTFPLSGDIELNFGTLVLGRDLRLQDVAGIKSIGNIFGNNYVLDLAATTSCIPSGEADPATCNQRFLTSSLQVDQVLTVDWSFDDKIVAVGLAANGAAHDLIYTYLFDGTSLTAADSDQPGAFTNVQAVRWHPSLNLLALGKVAGAGSEVFTYSVDTSGNLTQVDSDDVGTINAVAWHPTGDYLATGGTTNTAEIRIYPVDSAGDLDIPNRLDVNVATTADVQKEALDWDTSGVYLAAGFNPVGFFGSGIVRVFEFSDSPSLSLTENATVSMGIFQSALDVSWNPVLTDIIAVGTGGFFGFSVRIYEHDGGAGTLTLLSTLALPEPVNSVDWNPDGTCLAVGTDVGTGTEFATYSYDSGTGALTLATGFEFSDDIQSVRWDHTGNNIAVGSDDDTLYIYETPMFDGCVTFSDLNISLRCNVDFKDCCIIFSGDNVIRGRGKYLSLDTTCTWVIDSESSLLLKDITVKGLQDPILQFMDNSSTLSLQDVTWVLDDDVTVTQGHFDVLKDFTIQGDGKKLIYQSEVASTIQPCGKMTLDYGVTFSYDPVTASQDLLFLVGDTSSIVLNGATFYANATGIRIARGFFDVYGISFLSAEGDTPDQGIIFGDPVAGSVVDLKIDAAATLEGVQGCVQVDTV